MTLAIDADCALTYWMSQGASRSVRKQAHHESLIERIEADSLPDWAYNPDGIIHVIAFPKEAYINRKGVSCRSAWSALPRDSFCVTDAGIPVVAPELCFLRLANLLSLPELVKAGNMLCSAFCFSDSECLVSRGAPITSAMRLKAYISKVTDVKGVKKARRALRFVRDGAASPPEIDTCILLSLTAMLGGYGCPLPEFNGHIELGDDIARALGYSNCYCDLLWRKERCAVEYTSELYHSGYQKQVKDEIRRAALESMGYRVHLITSPQLYGEVAFEGFARTVLFSLGKRFPNKGFQFQKTQYDLRRTILFNPSWVISRACRHRAE